MYHLSQLEKQQIGLRLPKYLIEEIDSFTKEYNVNRTDIIIEAIKSYLQEQKTIKLYENLEKSAQEAKQIIEGKLPKSSLEDLINEL
jgi:metal-responsive CopG/Arc/MetJ family transcriptional regulator